MQYKYLTKDLYPEYTKEYSQLNNKKKTNDLIKKDIRDENRHIKKNDTWMANKHMKNPQHH